MTARIKIDMSMEEIVSVMCEGNPGGMSAIMSLLKDTKKIDPQEFMEGFGHILFLDTMQIYGSHIYILWNDVCKRDSMAFIALIRAAQLGFTPVSDIVNLSNSIGEINMPHLISQVQERLEDFKKAHVEAAVAHHTEQHPDPFLACHDETMERIGCNRDGTKKESVNPDPADTVDPAQELDDPTPTRRPNYPGLVFLELVMEEEGLSEVDAAEKMGVSKRFLNAVLEGKAPINKSMAQAMADYTKTSADSWLNMQIATDRWDEENVHIAINEAADDTTYALEAKLDAAIDADDFGFEEHSPKEKVDS
ncbi:MAG: addiction module antidote protein, HigA family [Thalassobium sp.]|nr:MAG: addiction module antidote protein, HigA family [Thalassobium sp.]